MSTIVKLPPVPKDWPGTAAEWNAMFERHNYAQEVLQRAEKAAQAKRQWLAEEAERVFQASAERKHHKERSKHATESRNEYLAKINAGTSVPAGSVWMKNEYSRRNHGNVDCLYMCMGEVEPDWRGNHSGLLNLRRLNLVEGKVRKDGSQRTSVRWCSTREGTNESPQSLLCGESVSDGPTTRYERHQLPPDTPVQYVWRLDWERVTEDHAKYSWVLPYATRLYLQ